MNKDATTCEFGPCHCRTDEPTAVTHEGKRYCSERCVDGRGCDHNHCNCGDFPTAEPDPQPTRPKHATVH